MLRNLYLLILLVAGAGVFASEASAQTIPSPYRYLENRQSVSFFGGQLFTDRGELGLGPNSKQAGGVRYSLRLGGPFSVEASALYLPSTRAVFDTTSVAETPFRSVGTANLDLALLSAAIRFDLTGPRTYHNFLPYLVFGGGATLDLSSTPAIESEIAPDARFDFGTRFAGQIGAGIEWHATDKVALRLDARDIFWKLRTPKAFIGENVASSEWVQNLALSLGLVYSF